MTKFTIETYEGERCVVGRVKGIIVETYPTGPAPEVEVAAWVAGLNECAKFKNS